MRLRSKLFLGYAVVLALLIAVAGVAYRGLTSLTGTVVWVSRAQGIIGSARLITQQSNDMEAGHQGFMVAGKEELLQSYTDALRVYETSMIDLKKQVQDPGQLERLKKIEALVAEWKTEVAEPEIEARRKIAEVAIDSEHFQTLLANGGGKGLLGEMRAVIDGMIARFHATGNRQGEALTEAVARAMGDQERGQRGFLVSGQDEFMESYRTGQIELKESLAALRALVAKAHDRGATDTDLDELEQLAGEWLQKAGQAEIKLRHQVDAGQKTQKDIEDSLGRGEGKAILDRMRRTMDRMDGRFERAENATARLLLIQAAKAMVDQETGQLGFILTGKEEFLEPFGSGQEAFNRALADLRTLNARAYSIPGMIADLDKLEQLAAEWVRKAAEPEIAIREQMNQSAAAMQDIQILIEQGTGKAVLESLRDQLDEFIRVEENLLDRRHQNSDALVARNILVVSVGTLVAMAVGVATAFYISRSILLQVGGEPREIAEIADEVASGHLDVEPPGNTGGATGILAALITMLGSLRANRTETERQNWLKNGIVRLNNTMRGDPDLVTLASKVISEIATYLDTQVGAVYLLESGNDSAFVLLGSYAYTHRKNLSNRFRTGEGLVGQAALEKKQILIRNIPEDYIKVTSGLGERVPRFICVTPCLYEGQVRGVVEIGTLNEMTELQLEYLNQAMEALGIAVESATGRTEVARLLEESQQFSEELQAQQEELKAANEELEEQTKILQESEEKLKAQAEELQVTNEELEEKTESLGQQKGEVERANAELEEKRLEVEKKAEDLALASKYKSEFLANMSHELRTPLNSLLILASSLAENRTGNLTPDQMESARLIHGSGQDLLSLINEILDLSKIEAGQMDLHMEPVVITDLADWVRRGFKHVFDAKGLELNIAINTDSPAEITSDSKRVEQIIRNLLANAVKFTSEGGVDVRFEPADLRGLPGLAVAVKDTGIGIPKEKQNAIFEAFQQADGGTSRKYGGTGLGLSICRELAHLLGGEIGLESEEGTGSTFTVVLPVDAKSAANVVPDPREREPLFNKQSLPLAPLQSVPDDRESIAQGDRVILVVEDDPVFAKLLLGQCREKGFKGLVAANGEEGLRLAVDHVPHAVILDIKLPGMDGWAVLNQLKETVDTRHVPVHIMSAGEPSQDALSHGAIGFLQKPASSGELQAAFGRIEDVLDRKMKRVLIVEDDETLRMAIVQLVGDGDVDTDETGFGQEAIEKLKAHPYDCMILDLKLTDMSGFELLEKVGKMAEVLLPPVVVYTGRELTREENEALCRYSESIILKGVRSEERLFDEVSLFLHRIVKKMPEKKRRMITNLHDADHMFEGRKVLIVDDDMRNLFALSNALERKGIQPLKAEDGKKALRILKTEPDVDLVLMDIMMPVMDGCETMKRIRAQKRFDRLPIIALTAKAMAQDRKMCIDAGASDYLPKPVEVSRLFSMMRVWMYR